MISKTESGRVSKVIPGSGTRWALVMMIDVMPDKEEEYKMSKEFVGLELIGPKRFQGEVCCAFVFCINWDLIADRLFCSSF